MSKLPKYWQNIIGLINRVFRINAHNDFIELFFVKEAKELRGKKNINLVFIIIILFLTFTAIGFANGSLEYLSKKMNDPFVKFVNIQIKKAKSQLIGQIQYELNHDTLAMNKYSYNSAIGYNRIYLSFWGTGKSGNEGTYTATGRTIHMNDPLLNEILGSDNLIVGRSFRNDEDFGLIVSEDFLEEYHFDKTLLYLPHSFPYNISTDTISPLPVIAVVKELPGLNNFAVTPYFNSQRSLSKGNPFSPYNTDDIIFFTSSDSSKIEQIVETITHIINENDQMRLFDPMIDIIPNNESYLSGNNIRISFLPNPSKGELMKFSSFITKNESLSDFSLIQIYDYNPTSNKSYDNYDILSVHFNNLNSVREFKEFLLDKYGLEIDMARIEALENYNFITKITRIISILLIGFSILSICLFVGNILSKHLEKIHMNIGTFKAFGISNNTLHKIYLLLIYFFILFSMIVAFAISWGFGSAGGARLVLILFDLPLETNQDYFNLFDTWTYLAIILTLLISYVVLSKNAGRILKRSPGDLIYSRI